MDLAAAFGADRADCLAVVGAGGKKSTLYALAAALERAVLTSTVRPFPDDADPAAYFEDREAEICGNCERMLEARRR